MYRFWPVIAELLKAVDARRICEIGADNGLNTAKLLEHCAAQAAFLEVIDPLPKFDVDAWRAHYPNVWTMHRMSSIEALARIEACQVYLIDGDHNWYTVIHELRMIRARTQTAGGAVVVLHDTAWPYGRRDLYYAPERIPDAYRHPYAQRPILPGVRELADHGLNAHLHNAVHEGAPRSGVLAAVEDYLAESGSEFRAVHLRSWFGLTVLVPSTLLTERETLSRLVERLAGLSEFGVMESLEENRVALLVSQDRQAAELASVRSELDTWKRRATDAGAVEPWTKLPLVPTWQLPAGPLHRPRQGVAVDVVIAVYDALDYVRACLESVRQHSDGFHVRVLVVNDGSGPATVDWLRGTAASWPDLELIEQPTNLGYTRALNSGLRASTAPWVVALNSDTVVTEGWLAGLIRCAEADPSVGLVGPLSNAASWQSVPTLLDDDGQFAVNRLPRGLDADGMARIVAAASEHRYPKVPVLNGFCLLLRREVLERVGLMDEAAFAVGYGEENDYCMRAAAAGYSLAVADDVYVFHAKSKSFGHAARLELSSLGAQALNAKHGASRVQDLIRGVRDNAALQAVRCTVRDALAEHAEAALVVDPFSLRVLFLLPVIGQSGGANSVIQEAAEMARLGAFVRVAVPSRSLGDLGALYAEVPGIGELLVGMTPERLIDQASDFDVVVGTVYYTMEWVAQIVARHPRILAAYYVQDYEPWFFEEGSSEQRAALASYTRVPGALLLAKTHWLLRLLAERHGASAHKIAPSLDHATFFPSPRVATGVIRIVAMVRPQTPRRAAPRTMRVLRDLWRRHAERVEIHLFGCESSDQRFLPLERDFRFQNHGVLRRPQVAELLRRSDLFIDLSDYQAFGRAALEALASGCVCVVPAAGGGDEFADHGRNALVVDSSQEDSCIDAIDALLRNPTKLQEMRRAGLATAARFSVHRAALGHLHALADAATAWRRERPADRRKRLTITRLGADGSVRLGQSAGRTGWKLPSVQRTFRVSESERLPQPGSADVALVVLESSGANWEELGDWLALWRCSSGRVVVHLELLDIAPSLGGQANRSSAVLGDALRWLASAADALTVSSAPLSRGLAALGIPTTVVPAALDAIVWRTGPAGRRLADLSEPGPVRIGYLAGSESIRLPDELRQALTQIERKYGDRVLLQTVKTTPEAVVLGENLRAPRCEDEWLLVEWLFGNARWDIALAPVPVTDGASPADEGDTTNKLWQYAALGAAIIASDVGPYREFLGSSAAGVLVSPGADANAWHDAIVRLLEDRALRERMVANARIAVEHWGDQLDRDGVAASLLDEVLGGPSRSDVPELPASLRSFVRSLFPKRQASHAAKFEAAPLAFPAPRSKMQRKLDKLRRDPAAFFRDAKIRPLRLLKGFFG